MPPRIAAGGANQARGNGLAEENDAAQGSDDRDAQLHRCGIGGFQGG